MSSIKVKKHLPGLLLLENVAGLVAGRAFDSDYAGLAGALGTSGLGLLVLGAVGGASSGVGSKARRGCVWSSEPGVFVFVISVYLCESIGVVDQLLWLRSLLDG